jgi:hypothetical protein
LDPDPAGGKSAPQKKRIVPRSAKKQFKNDYLFCRNNFIGHEL